MNPEALKDIEARASTLWDRLAMPESSRRPEAETQSLWNLWADALGSPERFRKRLEWSGLTEAAARTAIASVPDLPSERTLPSWCLTIQAISDAVKNGHTASDAPCFDPEHPAPFEDLLFPAVLWARSALALHPAYRRFSSPARTSLDRSLLRTLAQLCAPVLEMEFSKARRPALKWLAQLLDDRTGTAKEAYEAFVRSNREDGLERVFREYPVLARLVGTTIDSWVEVTREFLSRLESDLPEFGETEIRQVRAGLSDPHRQGRTAMLVEFGSGRRLVYKPKPLGIEHCFGQLLRWCNEKGLRPELKAPAVWDHGRYGWAEFVEQRGCADLPAADRYFERAGSLLCLLYVLHASDCHRENVVAHGDYPILVDIETVLRPEPRFLEEGVAFERSVWESLTVHTVLTPAFLPGWEASAENGAAFDLGGLAWGGEARRGRRTRRLTAINTDQMRYVDEYALLAPAENAATLGDKALVPMAFLDRFQAGFRRMYRLLLENREELSSSGGPLEPFRDQRIRFVLRNSPFYGAMLSKSQAPEWLRDGAAYSIGLESMVRGFTLSAARPHIWPMLAAELKALEQRDIPYFSGAASSRSLDDGPEPAIDDYFALSGFENAIRGIRALSEQDLDLQSRIIEGSFVARAIDHGAFLQPSAGGADLPPPAPLQIDEMIAEADRIAFEIASRAVRTVRGHVFWHGVSPVGNAACYRFGPLSAPLYEGQCGVALFLAALDRITGAGAHRALVDEALAFTRDIARDPGTTLSKMYAAEIGLGGLTGIPSMIYALVSIAELQRRSDLVEDATRLAELVTVDLIAQDRSFDIVSGGAGAILGLLRLYHATADPAVLQKARGCGDHLLQHRSSVDGLPPAWRNFAERPLTGFSHGAAGIAHALLQLHVVTGDLRYREAALDAIGYERACFSRTESNWPDLRDAQPAGTFRHAWCHGAAGIGLSRIGARELIEDALFDAEIEAAVQATCLHGFDDTDHLCCGNFGRIEFLCEAGLRDTALLKARRVYEHAQSRSGYWLVKNRDPRAYSPALFCGTAGIGYQLLRMARPGQLESILLLR